MQQKQKLESFMAPSKTGQQQIELVKASQCLSELGIDRFHLDNRIVESTDLF
jgi:hypothetical protein